MSLDCWAGLRSGMGEGSRGMDCCPDMRAGMGEGSCGMDCCADLRSGMGEGSCGIHLGFKSEDSSAFFRMGEGSFDFCPCPRLEGSKMLYDPFKCSAAAAAEGAHLGICLIRLPP